MVTLYSYCVLHDNGAAPNPFWNVCTLAICKPSIRRNAKVGDWVVGTGSKSCGFENQMIYAMKVTGVMSFEEYDKYCKKNLKSKIPDWNSKDVRRQVGDCIYDFSKDFSNPTLRDSVHTEKSRERDLSGRNVLLSEHFYYFGSQPVPLPNHLLKIVRQGQGHKSSFNQPWVNGFVEWIETFNKFKNVVTAMPHGLKDFAIESCEQNIEQKPVKECINK